MQQTPRKSSSEATELPPTPLDAQRKRGRQRGTPGGAGDPTTPSPARRRGCNCKKSGCLKLYCECFAANVRCGDRCQCMGCRNREHNRLEIAHAMEAIEKRNHRNAKSPLAAARKLENLRASTPLHGHEHGSDTGLHTPMDGATRLLLSAERLEETPQRSYTVGCICTPGACNLASPCHEKYGGCSRLCACHQVPMSHEKTKGCSCKKSNCLKLYCECLAAQRMCDGRCNCECCKNRPENHEERERAITAILERNPLAFQPKVATGATQHLRGCNCRKSNCMKNYCECHQAGVPCTSRCACQGCRNTDAFVSAKKMLIFSGDLKMRRGRSGKTSSPEILPAGIGRPPRLPLRRASMDNSSPHSRFLTPTTSRMPGVVEIAPRTAPLAQLQPLYGAYGGHAPRAPTHAKRKLSEIDHAADESQIGADSGAKRSNSSASSRMIVQERLERVAISLSAQQLPSVEGALDAELNAAQPDLALSKLCRSLLSAATSVDMSPTPRRIERFPGQQRTPVHSQSTDDGGGAKEEGGDASVASPIADELLCEEDIETPTRPPRPNGSSASQEQPVDQRREQRLAAMQERAVLQEFSVWLRNLATSASYSS